MSAKSRPVRASNLSSADRVAVFMYKYTNENEEVIASKYQLTKTIVKTIYTGVTPLKEEDFNFEGCPITFEKYLADVKIPRKMLRPSVYKSYTPHKDAPKAEIILSMLRDKGAGLSAEETYLKYKDVEIDPERKDLKITKNHVKSAWAGKYKLAPGVIGEDGLMTQEEYDMLVGLKRDTKFKAKSKSSPGSSNATENKNENEAQDLTPELNQPQGE